MRDILVLALVLGGSIVALRRPWIGVLVWTWVSLMNPHRLSWGIAQNFPVSTVVAIATLIGVLFAKERRNPYADPSVVFLTMFMAWICITYPFSFYPDESAPLLTRALKIDLFILVTLLLLHSRMQIEIFAWVVVLSLGLLGAKGGLFTILTGGSYRVWGPGGFILENNAFALALTVTIPLIRFLQLQQSRKYIRHGLTVMMVLCAASVLGSQSRGGLLALSAMAVFLWLKSPRKLAFGLFMAVVAASLVVFMPASWEDRMSTIQTYDKDASSMGRINAWGMAWNLATDRVFGGGFKIDEPEVFARYAPDPTDIKVAHSIYFQILGEHGFIGLAIWLLIWIFVWRAAGILIKRGRKVADAKWCSDLGAMAQVSLIGYATGGAFLSQAYFDLPYDILALVVMSKRWLIQHERSLKGANSPTYARPPMGEANTIGAMR